MTPHIVAKVDVSIEGLCKVARQACLFQCTNHLTTLNAEDGTGGDREISAARVRRVGTHHAVHDVPVIEVSEEFVP